MFDGRGRWTSGVSAGGDEAQVGQGGRIRLESGRIEVVRRKGMAATDEEREMNGSSKLHRIQSSTQSEWKLEVPSGTGGGPELADAIDFCNRRGWASALSRFRTPFFFNCPC